MNIIDVHVHPCLNETSIETMKGMIRAAKKFGIQKMCLLGDVLRFGYEPNEKQVKKINDLTIKLLKQWPDFLIGFCFLNPKHSKHFLYEEIERCVIGEKFPGIKLEVAVNARDRRLDPIMEKAQEFNTTILHHSWNTDIIKNRQHQSDPEDIACLAARFPKVKIIMAHVTSASVRGILAIQPYKNVLADTSGSEPVAGTLECAVEKLGAERILYGSDVPYRDFSAQLGKIYGADISKKERELILGTNAQRLFGLS